MKNENGFTIVELLLALSLVSIVISLWGYIYINLQKQSIHQNTENNIIHDRYVIERTLASINKQDIESCTLRQVKLKGEDITLNKRLLNICATLLTIEFKCYSHNSMLENYEKWKGLSDLVYIDFRYTYGDKKKKYESVVLVE